MEEIISGNNQLIMTKHFPPPGLTKPKKNCHQTIANIHPIQQINLALSTIIADNDNTQQDEPLKP